MNTDNRSADFRFLIVGASGFIGSHLLRAVRERGYDGIGTRRGSSDAELIPFDLKSDRIGDCVPAKFWTSGRCVVVICAGISQIDRCFKEPAESRLVNVERTQRLCDDAAARGASIVFLSSSHVFDGSDGPYGEEAPASPINEYGRQKAEVERFLLAEHPDALIVRMDKVLGDDPNERHPLSELWTHVRNKEPIRCIEGQVLSPVHVDDVAGSILAACERSLTGVFHIAGDESVSRFELARRFVAAADATNEVREVPVEAFGFADVRPLRCCLDGRKLRDATGLRLRTVDETINSFLQNVRSGE